MIGCFQPDPTVLALIITAWWLAQPAITSATTFYQRILEFQPWPQPTEGMLARFQNDRELHWRDRGVPLPPVDQDFLTLRYTLKISS